MWSPKVDPKDRVWPLKPKTRRRLESLSLFVEILLIVGIGGGLIHYIVHDGIYRSEWVGLIGLIAMLVIAIASCWSHRRA